jgi:hypothetical protein
MDLILKLGGLLCIGGMAVVASVPFFRRPLGAAVAVLVVYLFEVWLYDLPPIQLGVLLYPPDILFGLLLVATLVRYGSGTAKLPITGWCIPLLFVLFSVSLLRGISAFGIQGAGVEGRNSFYFIVGLLYFSSFNYTRKNLRSIIRLLLACSTVMVAIAIIRWIAGFAGLDASLKWVGSGDSDIRVLYAWQALFLSLGFFASLFLNISRQGPIWQRNLFYVLGPIILLLQHRTVWAVMIVGILWLGLHDGRFRKKAIGAIIGMAIVGIVAGAFMFGHRSEIIAESLQNSSTNDDTLMWRVEGWYELIFNNPTRNTFDDIIGQPYGTGYERIISGGKIDYSPHNYYVETFLRLGIIGLLLLLRLYALGIQRLKSLPMQVNRYAYPDARFWALALVLQFVYFCTYGAPYVQSIFIGVAIAGFRLKRPRPAPQKLDVPEAPCSPA